MQDEELRRGFALRLNELLGRSQFNQKEFAKAVGVGVSTANGWFKGINIPRMDKIDKICKVLGTTRTYLIEGSDVVQRYVSDDEAELLTLYRMLEPIERGKIIGQLTAMCKEKKESLDMRLSSLDDEQSRLVKAAMSLSSDQLKQLNDLLGIR